MSLSGKFASLSLALGLAATASAAPVGTSSAGTARISITIPERIRLEPVAMRMPASAMAGGLKQGYLIEAATAYQITALSTEGNSLDGVAMSWSTGTGEARPLLPYKPQAFPEDKGPTRLQAVKGNSEGGCSEVVLLIEPL